MKSNANKPPESSIEATSIPQWHINFVRARLSNYKKNQEQLLDFDEAMDDIKKGSNTKL